MDGATGEPSIDSSFLAVTNTWFHGPQFRREDWDLRRFTPSHRRIRCICTFARDIYRSLPSGSDTSPCEVNRRSRERVRSWAGFRRAQDDRKAIGRRCHWYVVFNGYANRTWKYCRLIHCLDWKWWCCESVSKVTTDADYPCLFDAARGCQVDQHNERCYRIQSAEAFEVALRCVNRSRFEVSEGVGLLPSGQQGYDFHYGGEGQRCEFQDDWSRRGVI